MKPRYRSRLVRSVSLLAACVGALACQAKDAKPITLLSSPAPKRVVAAPSEAPPTPAPRGRVAKLIQLAQLTGWAEPTGGEPATAFPADAVHDTLEGQLAQLEDYITKFPDAPLTPTIRVDLAEEYRRQGRISRSLDHWLEAWAATSAAPTGEAKDLADYSLAELAHTLARMGRIEELELLMSQNNERTLEHGRISSLWAQTHEALAFLKRNPERAASGCGTYALNMLATRLGGQLLPTTPRAVAAFPNGLSLADLQELAQANKLGIVAAARPEGAPFVAPSLVHWKRQHYAVILSEAIGGFLVDDPTFEEPTIMSAEAIEEEASGYFLIPDNLLPPGWRLATPIEKAEVLGRYWPNIPLDDNEPPPCLDRCCIEEGSGPAGTGNDTNQCGMATWRIAEPHMNLVIEDIPMKYDAAYGPDFVLALRWRQRTAYMPTVGAFSRLSPGWYCDLLSFIAGANAYNQGLNEASFSLVNGEGYQYVLHFPSGAAYSDRTYAKYLLAKRTVSGSTVTTIEVYYTNGAYERYELIAAQSYYRLTLRRDATTQGMSFGYDDPQIPGSHTRLRTVTTADGKLFTFNYPTSGDLHRIASVNGPDYRTVSFEYASSGQLTNITDVVGLRSGFQYGYSGGWITNITTPYGATGFTHFDLGQAPTIDTTVDRYTIIHEPLNSRQLYLFYYGPPPDSIPTQWSEAQRPVYPGDNPDDPPIRTIDLGRNFFNSHYWNRQQAAQLPADPIDPSNFDAADYRVSRTRHWLEKFLGGYNYGISSTLSWELPPAQDGLNEAQPTFYDYAGKTMSSFVGTSSTPSIITQNRLNGPDWHLWYQYIPRNSRGMRTSVTDRWFLAGEPAFRTETFVYATSTDLTRDGLQLLEHRGPSNEIISSHTPHGTYPDQYGTLQNGAGEITTYNYLDATRRLWTVQRHPSSSGMLSTYTYGTDGRVQKILDTVSGLPIRTNQYTWLNGYLRTHTDARGLLRTFSFDYLGRLTQIAHPDATTEQLFYAIPALSGFNTGTSPLSVLDLTYWKDRPNNYWYALPNRLRQTEWIVEPPQRPGRSQVTTHVDYCSCGSPSAIIRGYGVPAVEQTTVLEYDFQGNLTKITLPEGGGVTNQFDALGRWSTRKDGKAQFTFYYDMLNRHTQVSNDSSGLVLEQEYDLRDRVVKTWDENRQLVRDTHDGLGRLLTRRYSDEGMEEWVYTAGFPGPTSYYDQLRNLTTWAYDRAGRRTNEAVVNVYTNSFRYTAADDLFELKDGKNLPTTWLYNAYGHATNKTDALSHIVQTNLFDANGRQTRRWTPAKGETRYDYDNVGNMIRVVYPTTGTLEFDYDALSRLKSMNDRVGSTTYGYTLTPGQRIVQEDGPWADDTIWTTNHVNRRTGLGVLMPGGYKWAITNAYSAARLASVASPAGTFNYLYTNTTPGTASAASLVNRILLPTTGGAAYLTNRFDSVGRLLFTELRDSAHTVVNGHAYIPNIANQRDRMTRSGPWSYYEQYTYDPIGQLKTATASTGSSESFSYNYDFAQNLKDRTVAGVQQTFGVDNVNQLNAGPTSTYSYDQNGNLTSAQSGQRVYAYDDENQLISVEQPNNWRTEFVYDGFGRLRRKVELSWTPDGGGGGGGSETEIGKGPMGASASSYDSAWPPGNTLNNITTDPGWHCDGSRYNSQWEFLRIDLAASYNVSRVAYMPRQMTGDPLYNGSWNGVFKDYEIYVTDVHNDDPATWGGAVAGGQWQFPSGPERKDVSLAVPKAGRYVIFRRVTAYGWYSDTNPGYASANEIWVYQTSGGGGETEVPKGQMTLAASSTWSPWVPDNARDTSYADPGWHNDGTYTRSVEYLKVDLGNSKTIGHVAYLPRQMQSTDLNDGSANGVYRGYEIYVTDSSGTTPAEWGTAAASGTWTWPSLQERKDVYFTARTGRYVIFRRVSAYGWYSDTNPGMASANEIWVYEGSGGGGGTWTPTAETRYIYDGMQVIQERDGSNTPQVAYTRGLDLSGTLNRAGGIGGLLARSHAYSSQAGTFSTHHFYHADGNGNVTYLVNQTQGHGCSYRYAPYGAEMASFNGSLGATDNAYRFSSKRVTGNAGLHYYGFRFYEPNLQRWANRDPLGESGDVNLYRFVGNAPITQADPFGYQLCGPTDAFGPLDEMAIVALAGAALTTAIITSHQSPVVYSPLTSGRNGPPISIALPRSPTLDRDKGSELNLPLVCESRAHGQGERNWAGKPSGTENPYKGWSVDPKDPMKVRYKDKQTGKWVTKPRSKDFPDPKPPRPSSSSPGSEAGR